MKLEQRTEGMAHDTHPANPQPLTLPWWRVQEAERLKRSAFRLRLRSRRLHRFLRWVKGLLRVAALICGTALAAAFQPFLFIQRDPVPFWGLTFWVASQCVPVLLAGIPLCVLLAHFHGQMTHAARSAASHARQLRAEHHALNGSQAPIRKPQATPTPLMDGHETSAAP